MNFVVVGQTPNSACVCKIFGPVCLSHMKNNNQSNGVGEKSMGHSALRLLIESLADLITKVRIDLLQQGNDVLAKIREVNDSVEIIAREIERQSERSDS